MKPQVNLMKSAALVIVALFAVLPLSAESLTAMRQLRERVREAKSLVVAEEICIEGFVVSNPGGYNNELNRQAYYASMRNMDLSTGYIESVAGDVGFKLRYATRPTAKLFPRYARIVLSLKGTTLSADEKGSIIVEGVTEEHIRRITKCGEGDLPRKEMRIAELTDDDIYTYVTLQDCEILFRDGAFSNVYEPYVQVTPVNKKVRPNRSMDCWATLICDRDGGSIYSLTNTLCRWRRNGEGVPQGSGAMRGVVTSVALARYGGDVLGRYALLPMDKEDYAMDWRKSESNYKSIAEWNWNDNVKEFSTDEGELTTVTTQRILADVGRGSVRLVAEGKAIRGKDTNNTYVAVAKERDPKGDKGLVLRGAMTIKTAARNWWDWEQDCGKGVEVSFSTEGLSGNRILFGFTFAAGAISANTSFGFPVYWNVEYSLDGKAWTTVEGSKPKKLRTLPWWWYNDVYGSNYESIEQGVGYTEHLVVLPASLLGQPRVYVRVVPVSKRAATLGYDYSENGILRPNSMVETTVNFGSFVVRYN